MTNTFTIAGFIILGVFGLVVMVILLQAARSLLSRRRPAAAGADATARTTTNTWSRVLLLWLRARMRPQPSTSTDSDKKEPSFFEKLVAALFGIAVLVSIYGSTWFQELKDIQQVAVGIVLTAALVGLWHIYTTGGAKWTVRSFWAVMLSIGVLAAWSLINDHVVIALGKSIYNEFIASFSEWAFPDTKTVMIDGEPTDIAVLADRFKVDDFDKINWRNLFGIAVLVAAGIGFLFNNKLRWPAVFAFVLWAIAPLVNNQLGLTERGISTMFVLGLTWLLSLPFLLKIGNSNAPGDSSASANAEAAVVKTPVAAKPLPSAGFPWVPLLVLAVAIGAIFNPWGVRDQAVDLFEQTLGQKIETSQQADTEKEEVCTDATYKCEEFIFTCDAQLNSQRHVFGKTWTLPASDDSTFQSARISDSLMSKPEVRAILTGRHPEGLFSISGDRERVKAPIFLSAAGSGIFQITLYPGDDVSIKLASRYCQK